MVLVVETNFTGINLGDSADAVVPTVDNYCEYVCPQTYDNDDDDDSTCCRMSSYVCGTL